MNNVTPSVPRSSDAGRPPAKNTNELPPDELMKRAVARIENSRAALIVCLSSEQPARHEGSAQAASANGAEQAFAQTLTAQIDRDGLAKGSWRTLRTIARRWWTRQPWHSSVDLIGGTLLHQARPLMRRHPIATLAVGAAAGAGAVAIVSAIRPWAWLATHGKTSFWRSRMGSLLWTQLTSAPLQMALAGALAAWLADQGNQKTRVNVRSEGLVPSANQPDATRSSSAQDVVRAVP